MQRREGKFNILCGQFFTAFLRVFHALFTGFSRTFYGFGPRTGFPRILACTHASVDKYQLIVVKTTVMHAQIASRPVAPFDLLFLIMSFDEQLAHGLKSTCQDADLVLLEFKAGLKPPCGNLGFQKQANFAQDQHVSTGMELVPSSPSTCRSWSNRS